jgi:hypothetical protein
VTRITAVQQGTNAQLIATAQALYPMSGQVFDMTPGPKLGFWSVFMPANLSLLHERDDFRQTCETSSQFDHVAFDPPYVTKGGHATSTISDMSERYGMLHVERSPMLQWRHQVLPGITEAHRLLKPGGLLWLKCMDYVTSGRVWWFSKLAFIALTTTGFDLVDEFILDGKPGPQPLTNLDGTPRRQVHAARAHSVLMIARALK